MKQTIRSALLLFAMANSISSCYRMPTDEDYSLVPSTNNPQITRQREESPLPQASY